MKYLVILSLLSLMACASNNLPEDKESVVETQVTPGGASFREIEQADSDGDGGQ